MITKYELQPDYSKFSNLFNSNGESAEDNGIPVISAEDIDRIKVLTRSYAESMWGYFISPSAKHYMKIPDANIDYSCKLFHYYPCGWWQPEKEEKLRIFLRDIINIPSNTELIMFWSASYAVETSWDIFINYWQHFFYRSDDGDIVIIPTDNRAIIYVEEHLWIVDRKGYFGQH